MLACVSSQKKIKVQPVLNEQMMCARPGGFLRIALHQPTGPYTHQLANTFSRTLRRRGRMVV